jgi:hypothetical protein
MSSKKVLFVVSLSFFPLSFNVMEFFRVRFFPEFFSPKELACVALYYAREISSEKTLKTNSTLLFNNIFPYILFWTSNSLQRNSAKMTSFSLPEVKKKSIQSLRKKKDSFPINQPPILDHNDNQTSILPTALSTSKILEVATLPTNSLSTSDLSNSLAQVSCDDTPTFEDKDYLEIAEERLENLEKQPFVLVLSFLPDVTTKAIWPPINSTKEELNGTTLFPIESFANAWIRQFNKDCPPPPLSKAVLFDIFSIFKQLDNTNIQINDKTHKAYIPFKDEKSWKEAKSFNLNCYGTLEEESTNTPSMRDVYYRSFLALSKKCSPEDILKLCQQDESISSKAPIKVIVEENKLYALPFFSNYEDWSNFLQVDSITRTSYSQPSLEIVHHLADTNDSDVFKLWVSNIPRTWSDHDVTTFLKKSEVPFLRFALVRDSTNGKSKRFGFLFVKGLNNFQKFSNKNNVFNLKDGKQLKILPSKSSKKKSR